MRGRPWLRLVLVLAGIALMGFPVYRVTHAAVPVPPAAAPSAPAATAAHTYSVVVTFAHAPASFTMTCLDKPVLSGKGPSTEFMEPWSATLPKEGADLLLRVTWPEGVNHTAVEVKVEDDGGALVDKTFWGTGSLTEIVTVVPRQS